MYYKIPLVLTPVLTPQPEGGYTVTSPLLPELVTEGDSLYEALKNVKDALTAVIELYHDMGRFLPQNTRILDICSPVWLKTVLGGGVSEGEFQRGKGSPIQTADVSVYTVGFMMEATE